MESLSSDAPKEDPAVPGRTTALMSGIASTISAVLLLAQFVALYMEMFGIVNLLGAASCVGWVITFVLVIDWTVFSIFPAFGPNKVSLVGPVVKLIASCFFNIQPWSALIAPSYGVPGIGVPWSNFVGILMFHTGNCIDSVSMYSLLNPKEGCGVQSGNWPVMGMWTLCTATWFLAPAGTIAFFIPDLAAEALLAQIAGSALLVVGSIILWVHFSEYKKPTGLSMA